MASESSDSSTEGEVQIDTIGHDKRNYPSKSSVQIGNLPNLIRASTKMNFSP